MLTEIYASRKESYKPQALFIFQIVKRTIKYALYNIPFKVKVENLKIHKFTNSQIHILQKCRHYPLGR